jgi:cytochrome c oxidase subunit 3
MSTSVSHGSHDEAHQAPMLGSMGVDSRKLGLWAFLGSETLFFVTLITTHLIFYARTKATLLAAGTLDHLDPRTHYLGIELTTVLATLLLASSLTMVLALAASKDKDWKRFRFWQLATILLGAAFVGGQVYEFIHLYHEGLKLAPQYVLEGETVKSLYGVTFFTMTGFHGLHVTIGIIWLIATYVKVGKFPNSPENPMDIELAGLYWHFVDLVWVAIFTLIYLI